MIDIDHLVANAAHYQAAARGAESLEIRRVVEEKRSDIVAAVDNAVAAGDFEKAARALQGYQRYLRDLGEERRVRDWIATLLEQVADIPSQDLVFFLHELQYIFDFHTGETAAAMAHVNKLFDLARTAADDRLLCRAYVAVCRLDLRSHDGSALEQHAGQLMQHANAADDDYFRAFSHHMVANLREMEGDAGAATESYRQSSRLFGQCGADFMVHTESFNLAACALDLGELADARKAFSDFAALSRELQETHLDPELLSCLSLLLLKEGDAAKAARLIGASESALEAQCRKLYPAEEKISAETVAMLTRQLGEELFREQLELGRLLSPADACLLAGFV